MNRKRLDGQIAWISGGASGMGEATAELFAEEGAKVAVVDIQPERGQKVVEAIAAHGGQAIFLECNVAREEAVRQSIEKTAEHFGGLQIVVNCAGVVHVAPLHAYSEQEWDDLMGVNVKSIFFSLKHSLSYLRQNQRSYMVNIGSVGSFIGQAQTPAYITSKHAVLGLSRSIALDYAADGLRCNCVCPGITDTPMLRFHLDTTPDPQATLANRLRRVPMGVALTPIDIARAVLYFSCEDSAGVTGTSLVVDGGYITAAEWETTGQTKFMEPL
ncbi:MAG: SDR family NAD(P)-dependent oxidoreductase [Candidatus Poribacteria bacterium]|nr:SDR family NAD(P)-dependent oxidoreductase [Candidatus Poribacteria bacterium]